MKKERHSKIFTIIALALTLVALTLGFAAFSTTLNISSNATVSPNQEDFKITIYGMQDEEAVKDIQENGTLDESKLSSTISYPAYDSSNVTAEIATINNSTHTISNINAGFVDPGYEAVYFFVIKNEGKYDAYLDLTGYTYENEEYHPEEAITGTCTPGEGTTASLVEETCSSVVTTLALVDLENQSETGDTVLTIPKDKSIILGFLVGYIEPDVRADGPFTVTFDDFKLNFSTTK